MNRITTLLLLALVSGGCTTLKDQTKLAQKLQTQKVDFTTLDKAQAELPCINYTLGDYSAVFEFGPGDKVLQLESTKTYVKKFCLSEKVNEIIVTGRHVGGGQGKAFYTVPGFVGYSSTKKVKAEYKMRQTFMAGHLEFTMSSPTPFDSLVVYLDVLEIDKPFGGSSNTMAMNPAISMPVNFYKFPEGEIGISSKK